MHAVSRGEGVLRQPTYHPQLRLIVGAAVTCDDAVAHLDAVSALKADARDFAARNGPNAYSDFVLKHGRRPDAGHAATLGRLINKQVRASDGSLQPRLSVEQRKERKTLRAKQKNRDALAHQMLMLTSAICNLADLTATPDQLIAGLSPTFDKPVIAEKMQQAIESLQRFAAKWQDYEGQSKGTP